MFGADPMAPAVSEGRADFGKGKKTAGVFYGLCLFWLGFLRPDLRKL